MENQLVFAVLIPLIAAVAILLLRNQMRLVRIVAFSGSLMSVLMAAWVMNGVLAKGMWVTNIGGWPPPFGITLAVDLFGALMLFVATSVAFLVLIFSFAAIDETRQTVGFYALYQFLVMGVCGSFITGDLFNLYVFFEIMLISSFGLMTLGGERAQLEGGLKYVVINMVSTILFISTLGILYGTMGTLNLADLSQKISQAPDQLVVVLASMFTVAFGIKAGLFPLFFWLPASYHTPPAAISALFAGLLTKVGIYALIRVFTLLFSENNLYLPQALMIIAGFTMVTGVLGAVAQYDFRRLLSFHIISQIGYMLMGLAMFTPLGIAGAIFHIIHNMIVKTNLFLISGIVEQQKGTARLKKLGGLLQVQKGLAILFFVSAMALAGIPPLSGFFSKFMLVRAGLEINNYIIVAVSLFVSILTLFSMTKIWNEVFWKPEPDEKTNIPLIAPDNPEKPAFVPNKKVGWLLFFPVVILTIVSVGIGFGAEGFYSLVLRAAETLLDSNAYVTGVLGAGSTP
jgi:multicomponent Na+:H+ antiporter subunit D